MGKYKKYKNRLEKYLSSTEGKRFFNFAYSFGAAIVILGTLFKILHLPGGNFMLSLGMGIEVVMFCIQAFDHPSREYNWEQVFPVLDTKDPDDRPEFNKGGSGSSGGTFVAGSGGSGETSQGNISGTEGGNGGTIIIGGFGGAVGGTTANIGNNGENIEIHVSDGEPITGGVNFGGGNLGGNNNFGGGGNYGGTFPPPVTGDEAVRIAGLPSDINLTEADTRSLSNSIQKLSAAADQLSRMAELTDATQQYMSQLSEISTQMEQFGQATQSLTMVSNTLLNSYKSITDNSDGISEYSQGYVSNMESLNRNLGGLNTIYEIQLKSISSQIDSIDRINGGLKHIRDMYEQSSDDSERYCVETEQMTKHIAQLNSVYEKMLHAMTINMYHPGMAIHPAVEKPCTEEEQNNPDRN